MTILCRVFYLFSHLLNDCYVEELLVILDFVRLQIQFFFLPQTTWDLKVQVLKAEFFVALNSTIFSQQAHPVYL